MRLWIVGPLALALSAPAVAQPDDPRPLPNVRFGLPIAPDAFPQKTPLDTVRSVVRAMDQARVDYALAHLADFDFVDGQLKAVAAGVPERVRAVTRKNPAEILRQVAAEADDFSELRAIYPELGNRVRPRPHPPTPALDEAKAQLSDLRDLLFAQVVADARRKLAEDNEATKALRRLAREGEVKIAGDTAVISDPRDPSAVARLKLREGRWFLENRRERDEAAPAPKPVEDK